MSIPSLSLAVGSYGCTAAIKDGSIAVRGIDARLVEVSPIIAAFRRMVRGLEFDICELAPTTYVVARAAGVPITALPVFLSRRFHHSGLQVRADAGIAEPKDLEGKRVGVRAYSVTTSVWTRGILMNEYGVDNDRIEWVVDDEEHVESLRLPPNVTHAPPGRSLSAMMAAGEIQAGFTSRAGIGRTGAPSAGWEVEGRDAASGYRELFEDAAALEEAWYRKTGIYPVHGCLVVRDDVLRRHPFLPAALFDAFEAAKDAWLRALKAGGAVADRDKYAGIVPFVGEDPLPNGLEANRETLEALVTYAWQQKLIPRRVPVEELFIDVGRAEAA